MRTLWGFLAGDAVSLAGTRISQIAVPWLVLTTTGSATRTGVVAFAEFLPLVLAQALGGPWIDRVGARRVAVGFDLASGAAVLAVPVLYAVGWLSFPLLVALVAVAGLLRGPTDAAHHALVPELVRYLRVPTERVTGLVGTLDRLASLTGAAIGGGLVALLGAANALLVDAGSFVVGGLLVYVATRGLPRVVRPADPPSYVEDLRVGWSFLRTDSLLLGLMVMVALTNMLDMGYSTVMLPVWAHEGGHGPETIGLLGACLGGAAIVGSLLATWRGPRLPRFKVYVVGYLLAGAPRWFAMALGLPVWAVAVVHVVGGFGSGFLNPVLGAVQFERIPEPLMGRVSAMGLAMSWSLMPLGGLVGGFVIAGIGIAPALAVFGGAYFLVTMAPVSSPKWRDMDRRTPLAGAAEPALR